jgi:putative membrane protein
MATPLSAKYFFIVVVKGILMGVANVIPGVSGGTIALLTNIYPDFLRSLKRFNLRAVGFLIRGKFRVFSDYINLPFIGSLFLGILISVFSLANIFNYLFREHPILIWSLFFGIILASVYYIAILVSKWTWREISLFMLSTLVSFSLGFLPSAQENHHPLFILLCGIISTSGMAIPGLSGSFLLILMGNYKLLMIESIATFNTWYIFIFTIGSLAGLVSLSSLMSFILRTHYIQLMAVLAGFVLGSLIIIWPWQEALETIESPTGIEIVIKYQRYFPTEWDSYNLMALVVIAAGVASVWLIEKMAKKKT